MHRFVIMFAGVLFFLGCSGKPKQPDAQATSPKTENTPVTETDPAPTLDTKGSLLREGYAACMIVYPKPTQQGDWLAMMKLEGEINTDKLPRIPLATSSTLTLLNIPPGKYTVHSKAWLRKTAPYAGGKSEELVLKAGELLILRASPISPDDPDPDAVQLVEAGRKTWTVATPSQLPPFVSQTADATRG